MTSPLALPLLALLALLAGAPPLAAQERRPERVEGYETVYRRVLTKLDAVLAPAPGGAGEAVPPFTPFYVFGARDGWLEVGPSASAAPTGWLEEGQAVEWRQNIVAAFTNPAGRSRQLIFETEEAMIGLMEHEAVVEMEAELLAQADAGTLAADAGVVSVEPPEHVSIQDSFYILPILEAVETAHPADYEQNLHLRIASLPERPEGGAMRRAADFEAGVVFVIDTTQSMEPFILKTREALIDVIEAVRGSEVGARVHFGAVAFRDNPDFAEGIEYRTQVIAPLERRDDATAVAEAIGATEAATVSTRVYNEDSLSGVMDAIEDMDWEGGGRPFGGRYVILVTDAGPKPGNDPDSGTGLDVPEVARIAAEQNIAILTLHVRSSSGAGNHDYAEAAYRELSRWGDTTFYYPISDGDPEAFEAEARRLAGELVNHVADALGQAEADAPAEARREDERVLGNAMLLAYLGGGGAAAAPDVVEGWVSDRAVSDASQRAVEARLLVTKNELATLAEVVTAFADGFEEVESDADSETFFAQMREQMLRMAQNPDRILNPEAEAPGDVLEFLGELPYRNASALLREDLLDVIMESPSERRRIIDGLRSKVRGYQLILSDPSYWHALHEGAPDGEHVYPMPLGFLP